MLFVSAAIVGVMSYQVLNLQIWVSLITYNVCFRACQITSTKWQNDIIGRYWLQVECLSTLDWNIMYILILTYNCDFKIVILLFHYFHFVMCKMKKLEVIIRSLLAKILSSYQLNATAMINHNRYFSVSSW
jgi:hypothetical protein